ncbi:hypothetical protein [Actinomyces sp.]|uniref:hypothetical protein n=1 Tax=Actinomyces sp. TaxID=29317 RepID=UPI0026DA9ABD|nr:hypothetical protein [Actinomyces sp.]MDO4900029.1 hypothetical protein [Actinomyces sp.]
MNAGPDAASAVIASSAVGSFKLGAPRLVGGSGGYLRARAEAEVDEIWARATERCLALGAGEYPSAR